MERTVALVRHAHAAPADDDAARRLTGSGLADAGALGQELPAVARPGVYAWVSTAMRARQTWAAIAAGPFTGRVEVDITGELYGADVEGAIDVIRCTPQWSRTVVVVGHNPGITDLAWALDDRTGTGSGADLERHGLVPGAAAALAYEGDWAGLDRGSARIRWTWAPSGR